MEERQSTPLIPSDDLCTLTEVFLPPLSFLYHLLRPVPGVLISIFLEVLFILEII